MSKTLKPFVHDCSKCEWVGWFFGLKHEAYNVYLCGKTVVIRYGDEGGDYWSSTAGMHQRSPVDVDTRYYTKEIKTRTG